MSGHSPVERSLTCTPPTPSKRRTHTVPVPGKLNPPARATWPAESARIYRGTEAVPEPAPHSAANPTRFWGHPTAPTATPPSPERPAPPRQREASSSDCAPGGPPGRTHLALVALFFFLAEVDGRQAGQVEGCAPTRARGRPQQEQRQQQLPPRWRRRRQPRAHNGCFGGRAAEPRG